MKALVIEPSNKRWILHSLCTWVPKATVLTLMMLLMSSMVVEKSLLLHYIRICSSWVFEAFLASSKALPYSLQTIMHSKTVGASDTAVTWLLPKGLARHSRLSKDPIHKPWTPKILRLQQDQPWKDPAQHSPSGDDGKQCSISTIYLVLDANTLLSSQEIPLLHDLFHDLQLRALNVLFLK